MSTGRLGSGFARRLWAPRLAERGVALLSVLLMLTLITFVTVAVMAVVQGDLAAGIRQQQAVQVFNIAEAGMHYAMARLQTSGADTYTGETVPIADGSTSLGQAQVTVECLDRTSPAVNSCAGLNAGYRRIRSTGSLTVSGPVRLVTAVVEGTTSVTSNYAVCGYDGVNFDQGTQVYGDVGSNANISLARGGSPSKICNSIVGGACTGPSVPPVRAYSGSAYAVGAVTCGGGACNSSQIEGTIGPNQPAGSVCPVFTLTPPSPPGTDNLPTRPDDFVPRGSTVTIDPIADPTASYGAVHLDDRSGSNVATLIIDSGSDPNATVTVRMRSLWLGRASRVVITGVGKVALWLLEPADSTPPPGSLAHQALMAEQQSIFGSTSTGATPVAVSGDRFTINVMSNKPIGDAGDCLNVTMTTCAAVHFNQSGLISGTFIVPGGGFELNQAALTNGAVLAERIQFDQNTTFTWDPNSRIGGGVYSNFNLLKAWKDQ